VRRGGTVDALLDIPFVPFEPKKLSVPYIQSVRTESNLPPSLFRSVKDLMGMTSLQPPWLAEPWVVAGAITELSGKVKSAGKTTFMTHLVKAIVEGADFLGKPTQKARVVYLTEQGPNSMVQALSRAGLLGMEDQVSFLLWQDVIGKPWPVVVQLARDAAREMGARLIIVDTLSRFAGVAGDNENDSGAALTAMAPLQEAAAVDDLAIITVRHDRKGGGEVGESARGSSAYTGAVDIVLNLTRGEGNTRPGVRILSGLSRFEETPDHLVIELTEEGYINRGTKKNVVEEDAKERILALLPADREKALTEQQIIEITEISRPTVKRCLTTLISEDKATLIGEGRKGSPFVYCKANAFCSNPPTSNEQKESPPW
jgi:hypothetical protein